MTNTKETLIDMTVVSAPLTALIADIQTVASFGIVVMSLVITSIRLYKALKRNKTKGNE